MKRAFDCVLSAICLIVFSPLLICCGLAIFIEDGKPVIFSQERIGLHGKPFRIYKFRSMHMGAESIGEPQLLEISGDSRLTRVGELKKTLVTRNYTKLDLVLRLMPHYIMVILTRWKKCYDG